MTYHNDLPCPLHRLVGADPVGRWNWPARCLPAVPCRVYVCVTTVRRVAMCVWCRSPRATALLLHAWRVHLLPGAGLVVDVAMWARVGDAAQSTQSRSRCAVRRKALVVRSISWGLHGLMRCQAVTPRAAVSSNMYIRQSCGSEVQELSWQPHTDGRVYL